MVTRKPLPAHPALDPALLQQAREAWAPSNEADDTRWDGEAVRPRQGQAGSTEPPPSDTMNAVRPGVNADFVGVGEEGNVWAESAAAPKQTDGLSEVPVAPGPGSSHEPDANGNQTAATGQPSLPVPSALGPEGGVPKAETNPFKRKMLSLGAEAAAGKQDSADRPQLPALPVDDFSQLSLNETSTNPWQPALDEHKATPPPAPRLLDQEVAGDNVWASAKPSRQPTPKPTPASPALLSLPSEEGSAGWEEEPKKQAISSTLIDTADEEVLDDTRTWDDLKPIDKGKSPAQLPPVLNKGAAGTDDWNLIDVETQPRPLSRQSTWENFKDEDDAPNTTSAAGAGGETAPAPTSSPQRSSEAAPPKPQRPVDKSETYQIKNITWHDPTAAKNPRTSPILVQNANGPCPLVALVNALSLTTPADVTSTALVETLRSREQVSLGLLLDAVFDELMSERRTQPDVPLPDMTELYDFLQGLHTGMNVNPRFIPTPGVVQAFKRTSLTHLHPTERIDMIPGTFEHTKEMALYSTFSIPLIHGWLPSKDDVVYEAFSRQAASYEDAQNLLFREDELEEKLCDPQRGLSLEEQQIYQDLLTIKSFLSISATQLTRFGLDVIRRAMKPGSVAILFRNDHFATLYRHPQTLELFTLVTDAGYAGHAEVVWESLVDVNGESAEFFSGDFRLVGGAAHDQPGPSAGRSADAGHDGGNDGWTTVQSRRGRAHAHASRQSASVEPPLSPNHEQEDRDLALALQLQEEEDERARADQARRRRESMLSEQYIEQQARTGANTGAGGHARRGSSSAALATGRARGASHSTTSLTSSTGSSGRRQQSAPRAGRAASTSSPSLAQPAHQASSSDATTAGRPRPSTQTVRSLLPPHTTTTSTPTTSTVTATNRPANADALDDDDVPPPSYEQAAKQLPYVPPAGHPSHPASPPTADGASGRSGAAGGGFLSAPPPSSQGWDPGLAPAPGQAQGQERRSPRGGYPAVHYGDGRGGEGRGGYRRGWGGPSSPAPVPAGSAAGGGSGRERDCVVM